MNPFFNGFTGSFQSYVGALDRYPYSGAPIRLDLKDYGQLLLDELVVQGMVAVFNTTIIELALEEA